jgi:pimeloyl-ACP methyl ester carboxylesterase
MEHGHAQVAFERSASPRIPAPRGGPGALAAAAAPGGRVTRAGVASGAGPFQLVPGALDSLDDDDSAALSPLPADPAAAAAAFAAGFEPLAGLAREPGGSGVAQASESLLSERDAELLADPRFAATLAATMREGLRTGTSGGGWDNVSWVGAWDIHLTAVNCPVLLWYGSDDRFAPPAHGRWLAENLPRARLVLRAGEGHFGICEHLGEMLAPDRAGDNGSGGCHPAVTGRPDRRPGRPGARLGARLVSECADQDPGPTAGACRRR